MAKAKQETGLTEEQDTTLNSWLNGDTPKEDTPAKTVPKDETPVEQPKNNQPEDAPDERPNEGVETTEGDEAENTEPELIYEEETPVTAKIADNEWDNLATEAGFEAKGKEGFMGSLKAIQDENKKLREENENRKNFDTVSEQVQTLNSIKNLSDEALVRYKFKNIDKFSDEKIEAKVQRLTDKDDLEDTADDIRSEIESNRQYLLNNASSIRKQKEEAQTVADTQFRDATINKIKSITNISGVSFKKEDLGKIHGRAERILASKEFQEALRNPDFVAELAVRKAVGDSLDKMLNTKFRNEQLNKNIKEFGNPTQRGANGVQRPKHLEDAPSKDENFQNWLKSDEKVSIGRA